MTGSDRMGLKLSNGVRGCRHQWSVEHASNDAKQKRSQQQIIPRRTEEIDDGGRIDQREKNAGRLGACRRLSASGALFFPRAACALKGAKSRRLTYEATYAPRDVGAVKHRMDRPGPSRHGSDHIIRRQRPHDPFQLELTRQLDLHGIFNFRQHPRTDQDLPWLRFIA